MKNEGIVVNFTFPEGAKENFRSALLPCAPRVGDKVKSGTPGSGVYRVKSVAFEIEDFSAGSNLPRATLDVELEGLDEISSA